MYKNLSVRLRAHPLYRAYIEYITENFKTFTETVKTQYKGVIAQRIRRTIQYENTHGHKSLIRFLQSLQNAFLRRKGARLSALFAASMFSWNEEIITDQEISRFVKSQMLNLSSPFIITYWANLQEFDMRGGIDKYCLLSCNVIFCHLLQWNLLYILS